LDAAGAKADHAKNSAAPAGARQFRFTVPDQGGVAMRNKAFIRIAAGCLAAFIMPAGALAQGSDNYPSKAVTIIVPVAPGAATENEGRIWALKLSEGLGQQFVMDFKPGAATTLGMGYLARQKPDGYTLGYVNSSLPLAPLLYRDLQFDTVKSFEQISLLGKRGALLAVSNHLPIRNVQEYIAYARANPEKIDFATSGNGGIQHLVGLWFTSATNTRVNFIHYKAAAAAYPDFLAGRVQMMPLTYSGGFPSMVKTGKVRSIGTANLQRSPMAPDMPTMAEQGVPDYEYPSWLGIVAPAKTPAAIINKLHGEIVRIGKLPDVRQKLGEDAFIMASTPEQFRRQILGETERWRKLVQDNNIKFDETN
jgi:tripartite-type tricarboxylate transporter receptor subunit TctC